MAVVVVDASVVIRTVAGGGSFTFHADRYLAPPLLWSEVPSAIHEAYWRKQITLTQAGAMRAALSALPVERDEPGNLADEAWRLADELGWTKTYDAEYVALANLHGCRLVTTDERLRRGAARLGFVVGPTELSN